MPRSLAQSGFDRHQGNKAQACGSRSLSSGCRENKTTTKCQSWTSIVLQTLMRKEDRRYVPHNVEGAAPSNRHDAAGQKGGGQ